MPTLRVEVLACAIPPLTGTGEPRLEPSTINWTVPVGVTDAGATGVIVAVNVTVCPDPEGFADEVTAVVVSAALTTTDSLGSPQAVATALLLGSPL